MRDLIGKTRAHGVIGARMPADWHDREYSGGLSHRGEVAMSNPGRSLRYALLIDLVVAAAVLSLVFL